jgi:hypothetical protein
VIADLQAHQARIATLYLPFLTIILEHKNRLIQAEGMHVGREQRDYPNGDSVSVASEYSSNSKSSTLSNQSILSVDSRNTVDPQVLALISNAAPPNTRTQQQHGELLLESFLETIPYCRTGSRLQRMCVSTYRHVVGECQCQSDVRLDRQPEQHS